MAPQPMVKQKMSKTESLKQMKDTLFYQMERSKKKLDESIESLNKNFYYYFSWVGIDALESDINYHLLKKVYEPISEAYDSKPELESARLPYFEAYHILYSNIKENKEFCSRAYNVRSSSTSELSNITSTVEFKMRLELIETFQKNLSWYIRETDLTEEDLLALNEIKDKIDSPDYKPGIWKHLLG